MKKLLSVLLASTMAFSALGGLAACGGDDNKPGPGGNKVTLPTVQDTDDPLASMANEDLTPVADCTLTIMGPSEAKDYYESRAAQFTSAEYKEGKYANVTIAYSPVSEGEAATQLLNSPEDAGDIFFFASDQYASLKAANALQRLSGSVGSYYSAAIQQRDDETTWKLATDSTGICWAFPAAVNAFFMWYDSTFYTDPSEVVSFEAMVEKAQGAGKNIMWKYNDGWYAMMFFHSMGCTTDFDENGNYVTDIDGDKGWIAAQGMKKFLTPDNNNNCIITPTGELNTDLVAALNAGTTVAGFNGDWISKNLNANIKSAILPTWEDVDGEEHRLYSFYGAKYCGVNAKAAGGNQVIAMALANFLTNEAGQYGRYDSLSTVPTNIAAAAQANNAVVTTALAQSEYSYPQDRQTNLWTVVPSFTAALAGTAVQTDDDLRTQLNNLAAGLRN